MRSLCSSTWCSAPHLALPASISSTELAAAPPQALRDAQQLALRVGVLWSFRRLASPPRSALPRIQRLPDLAAHVCHLMPSAASRAAASASAARRRMWFSMSSVCLFSCNQRSSISSFPFSGLSEPTSCSALLSFLTLNMSGSSAWRIPWWFWPEALRGLVSGSLSQNGYGKVWTPLKNMRVSWDDEIPNWMESHKIPWFQTTNQDRCSIVREKCPICSLGTPRFWVEIPQQFRG